MNNHTLPDSPASYSSKAEQIAQALLAWIATSKLGPGDTLATEAELLAQFGVSRPTLRESLRILESQEVIRLRPGPGGGILVRRPSVDTLAHSFSVFLRLNDVPFIEVLKAREAIEPALAAEAALNGEEVLFEEMQQSIVRMKQADMSDEAFVAENRMFHRLVAQASGNEVLKTFWEAISIMASGEHHGIRYSFGNRRHIAQAHQAILDACRRRDAQGASSAMASHVGELEHLVRTRYMHLLEQPTQVTVRTRRPSAQVAGSATRKEQP
ncbi:GntR family transcriptional regulator [Agaricicola taiwanensis]|uniref:GntR family transcriptional regulator n=1 Tax=Agaricicola taiwanensis TaxID=591372 RepID=A0A8J2YJ22_9RHOB|nr:FCD domain-containing protein [Agaricicola taiwanensis]GGE45556.1 GntR family transcriptional regulator [Agaricicola taiwanensis]